MIHVAIAEDDPNCAKQLERFLREFGRESGRAFQITHYDNGEDLIEQYRSNFDLIFLDIEMPFVDGLTAAKHIRQIDPKVIMIFITNLAQYAIRGYEVNALDYIVKPIKYTSFSLHLSRAMPHLSAQEDTCLVIAVKGGVVKLDPDSILYIESQKNQLLFHTAAQVHTSTVTLQKIEDALAGKNFFRCSKSYLVNLAHVDGFRDGCAIVHGEQIQVSRSKKQPFLDALNQYMGDMIR